MEPNGGSWLDQLIGVPESIGGFFGALENLGSALMDPQTYVRIFFVVFGIVLILGALRYA